MSIDALLQAAEFLERRERGEFCWNFVRFCLRIHVNMAEFLVTLCCSPGSADFFTVFRLYFQKQNMDTLHHYLCRMISNQWRRGQKRKNLTGAGKTSHLKFSYHFLRCKQRRNSCSLRERVKIWLLERQDLETAVSTCCERPPPNLPSLMSTVRFHCS